MPWIFLCLMLANAVYFGWEFMEGTQPAAPRQAAAEVVQQGEKVLLLRERPELIPPPAPEVAANPSDDKTAQDVAPVVASGPQCFSVGPFASDAALQKFTGTMRNKHFFVRLDKRKVDGTDYWVFIPAFTNREKAESKLRDLKARGISGFVVKDGVFMNAISLNHFSRKDLAQAFLEKMQAAGVGVEYREISQSGTERWLYLAPSHAKEDLRAAIDGQIASADNLKRENAACEE